MPGVNLSQSIAEKSSYQAKSGGESGRLVIIGLFLLTLLVWGGVRAGIFSYDRKIAAVQQEIEEKKASFSGLVISDIADVDARLTLINQKKPDQVYPKTVLAGLETTILPANRLRSFEFDFAENRIEITGEAPGYKEVAQQLMAFKTSPLFSDTIISNLAREKEEAEDALSVVTFDITTVWSKQN